MSSSGITYNPVIEDLLLQWEENYQAGTEVSIEELCKDHKDLIPEVQQGIEALKKTQSLFDAVDNETVDISLFPEDSESRDRTIDEIVDYLQHLGIAELDAMQRVRGQSDPGCSSRSFCTALVDEGLVTRFQGKVALSRSEFPLVLGEYTLLKPVGAGGMGAVYQAWHKRLNRKVALKIISPERIQHKEALARFEREIQVLAQLEHPNVVAAYDAGESGGTMFLVMQLIDGVDAGFLTRTYGKLNLADACSIVQQAAKGMAIVHDQGVIHRDIKPSNLIVSREGVVKLADLGLARYAGPLESSDITGSNKLLGTIDFMSPEQGQGAIEIDHRTDIYSLGATLYKLLSGASPLGDSVGKLDKAAALARDEAEPLHKTTSNVPARLSKFVAKMMSKSPGDRPATFREVVDFLSQYTHGADLQSLVARRQEYRQNYLASRAKRSWFESPRRVANIGFFALALLAGVIFLIKNRDGSITRMVVDSNSTVSIDLADSNPEAVVRPAAELLKETAVDRAVALSLLNRGVIVEVKIVGDSGTITLEPGDAIPESPFFLHGLNLRRYAASLTDADLKQLSSLTQLSQINLYRADVSHDQFARLVKIPTLKSIFATYLNVPGESILALKDHPNLEHINLWGGDSYDPQTALEVLTTIKNLKTLNIGYWRSLTDQDLAIVCNMTSLESLWLEGNKNVTSEGLLQLRSLKNLKTLALAKTQVDDACLKVLFELPKIEFLQLRTTEITKEGIRTIANAKNLKSLSLPSAVSDDETLEILSACKMLNDLTLMKPSVSDDAMAAFRKALPKCVVSTRAKR